MFLFKSRFFNFSGLQAFNAEHVLHLQRENRVLFEIFDLKIQLF